MQACQKIAGLYAKILNQAWDRTPESAFLANSQVMLVDPQTTLSSTAFQHFHQRTLSDSFLSEPELSKSQQWSTPWIKPNYSHLLVTLFLRSLSFCSNLSRGLCCHLWAAGLLHNPQHRFLIPTSHLAWLSPRVHSQTHSCRLRYVLTFVTGVGFSD